MCTTEIHYVYKITNLKPSDKRLYYIGVKSSLSPITDNYMGSSKYLDMSMKEIGQENFRKEILSTWSTRKEALQEEIRLHNYFDVAVNESFYNKSKQTSTGFDRTGVPHTTEVINNMKNRTFTSEERKVRSINAKGVNNSMYGKKHSEESRKKMSETKTGIPMSNALKNKFSDGRRKGENHPLFGKNHSDESKRKISESKKGIKASLEARKNQSIAQQGLITVRSVSVSVYNSLGELQYTFPTGFRRCLKENNLPDSLTTTLADNSTLFETEKSVNMAKKRGVEHFIGWYARRD